MHVLSVTHGCFKIKIIFYDMYFSTGVEINLIQRMFLVSMLDVNTR